MALEKTVTKTEPNSLLVLEDKDFEVFALESWHPFEPPKGMIPFEDRMLCRSSQKTLFMQTDGSFDPERWKLKNG